MPAVKNRCQVCGYFIRTASGPDAPPALRFEVLRQVWICDRCWARLHEASA